MKIKIIINFKKIIWTSKIDMGMLLLRTLQSITNFKKMAHPTHLKFLELWEARFGNYSFLIYTISPHLPTTFFEGLWDVMPEKVTSQLYDLWSELTLYSEMDSD